MKKINFNLEWYGVEKADLFIHSDSNEVKIFVDIKFFGYNEVRISAYYYYDSNIIELWINEDRIKIYENLLKDKTGYYYNKIINYIKNLKKLRKKDFEDLIISLINFFDNYFLSLHDMAISFRKIKATLN